MVTITIRQERDSLRCDYTGASDGPARLKPGTSATFFLNMVDGKPAGSTPLVLSFGYQPIDPRRLRAILKPHRASGLKNALVALLKRHGLEMNTP
jgi:hypothetical protein